MLHRIRQGFGVLRPRSIAQMRASIDAMTAGSAELTQTIRSLEATVQALDRRVAAQQDEIATLASREAQLALRESQLRAITRREIELETRRPAFEAALADPGLAAHVEKAITASTLQRTPFPYAVIDQLLPKRVWDAVVTTVPPYELFADRAPNKQQLLIPFELAPYDSRRVWHALQDEILPSVVVPALARMFAEPMADWVRESFGVPAETAAQVQYRHSNGRIMLRTRGYRIPPHRDPKWGFLTCILYLARPEDDERWGTQILDVVDDREAGGVSPYWIKDEQCRVVDTVAFKPNRLLVFLNSVGAHSAEIPETESPALQRHIYQFRIGPDQASRARLVEQLPADRRRFWEGKASDY